MNIHYIHCIVLSNGLVRISVQFLIIINSNVDTNSDSPSVVVVYHVTIVAIGHGSLKFST